MGRPLPGWSLTVLADEKDEPAEPGVLGRVAIDVAANPLMTFRSYQIPGQSDAKFTAVDCWYLTGDARRIDADNDFFFASRDDDVIIGRLPDSSCCRCSTAAEEVDYKSPTPLSDRRSRGHVGTLCSTLVLFARVAFRPGRPPAASGGDAHGRLLR